jgi:hypothetical protein
MQERYLQVKWVLCYHGMARPQVADRADGLRMWRVAANILNKRSRTADRGWSSSLGAGRRLKTLTVKIVDYVLRIIYKSLGNGSSWLRTGTSGGLLLIR